MAFNRTIVAALMLASFLAAQTAAQTNFISDGKGVVINDDGSLSVLIGGQLVYTSAPGLFSTSDISGLKGPVPGPIPDIGALIPSLPPKEDEDPTSEIQSVLGLLTGRKMLSE